MEFKPIINTPATMDTRIFFDEPMNLKDSLLSISLIERMQYDARKQTLFYNFQGLRVKTKEDVDSIQHAVENLCEPIGKKVPLIINYDDFQIDESVVDEYAKMVKTVTEKYYTKVSRYTTSAFMRLKLGEALKDRGLSPHIYETRDEAIKSLV